MKIRVYTSRAISAIVCIESYPTLIAEIFDNYFDVEYLSKTSNQNCINGVLEILNSLVDKYGKAIDLPYLVSRLQVHIDMKQ